MGKISTSLPCCIEAVYNGKLKIEDIDMVYEGTIIGDEQNYGAWIERYGLIQDEDTTKSVEILKQLVNANKVTIIVHQCEQGDTVYSVNPSTDGLNIELKELDEKERGKYATRINGKNYKFYPPRTILARENWADSIEELIGGELSDAFIAQCFKGPHNGYSNMFDNNERIAMMKIAFPQYTEEINTILRQYLSLIEQSTEQEDSADREMQGKLLAFAKNIPSLFRTLTQEKNEKENDELKMQMVSLSEIKSLYDEGIIKPYEEFCKDGDIRKFGDQSYNICSTINIAAWDNPRWRIVGGKNLFGLQAKVSNEGNNPQMVLTPCIGKFRLDRFSDKFVGPKEWDISDILSREGENKYKELREFYHMNNRQVFEEFGFNLWQDNDPNSIFVTNALLLDTLLNDRYSDIIDFGTTERNCSIKLNDETTIEVYNAGNRKGITIRNGKSMGRVNYTAKSIASEEQQFVTSLDQLDVSDVRYTGDERIIEQLKQAMGENFISQKQHSAEEIGEEVRKTVTMPAVEGLLAKITGTEKGKRDIQQEDEQSI